MRHAAKAARPEGRNTAQTDIRDGQETGSVESPRHPACSSFTVAKTPHAPCPLSAACHYGRFEYRRRLSLNGEHEARSFGLTGGNVSHRASTLSTTQRSTGEAPCGALRSLAIGPK